MKTTKKSNILYLLFRIFIGILLIISILGIFINAKNGSVSRYIFVAIQSIVLLLLSFGPSFASEKINLEIPKFMENIFLIFIISALLFGEIAEFFVYISWWDDMLHTTSGILITIVGFSIINASVNEESKNLNMNPIMISLFVFCFSMTVEVLWEIFEYSIDSLVSSSNMLRTRDSITLVPLQGLAAVGDTFHDIILTFIAALTVSILGYIDVKKNLGIFSKWLIKSKRQL